MAPHWLGAMGQTFAAPATEWGVVLTRTSRPWAADNLLAPLPWAREPRMPTIPSVSSSPSPSSRISTSEGVAEAPAPSTGVSPAAAGAGLDAATDAHGAPSGTVAPANTVGAGVSAVLTRLPGALSRPGPGLLELRPGVVPDAVSLTTVLKGMAGTPAGQQAVQAIVAELEGALGIKVPPALVSAAVANPDRLMDLLALTPADMKKGFDAMHAAHAARAGTGATAPKGKVRHLPQRVALEKALTMPIARPHGDLKTIAPGLLRGDVPSSLPDDQARRNMVLAEVFDRLAENASAKPADRFTLTFRGHTVTTLPGLLKVLEQEGYTLEGEVAHRIADFAALKIQQNGVILDVPAAVMVRTGRCDAQGQEAVLPSVHSELVLRIRNGPQAQGPNLEANLKWYQGVPNTGFFACDLMRKSTWTGTVVTERYDHAKTMRAAVLAGTLSNVINDVALAAGLAMNGYGVTGVCNDSVAVIQQALSGRVTAYPLFMRDAVLEPEMQRRRSDSNRMDDAALKDLLAAMAQSPSDDAASSSAAARALASIPWPAGQEPFASTVSARAILAQH